MNETETETLEQDPVFTPLQDEFVDVGEEGVSTSQQGLDLVL